MNTPITENIATLIATICPVNPPATLKSKIWQAISEIPSFPLLSNQHNKAWWDDKVKQHTTEPVYKGLYLTPIFQDTKQGLYLLWLNQTLHEEAHTDISESFLILEGACTFITEDKRTAYQAGDYVCVPDSKHTIEIAEGTSMKAIIERLQRA